MKEEKAVGSPPFFALHCCSKIHSHFSPFGSTGFWNSFPKVWKTCSLSDTHRHTDSFTSTQDLCMHTQCAGDQKIRINKACCKEMVWLHREVGISAGMQKSSICQGKGFAHPYHFKADH